MVNACLQFSFFYSGGTIPFFYIFFIKQVVVGAVNMWISIKKCLISDSFVSNKLWIITVVLWKAII